MKLVPTLDPVTKKIHKKFIPPSDGLNPQEIRSDVTSEYAYVGTAQPDTSETAPNWYVTRIHLIAKTQETAVGAWVDHLTLTYESGV